MNKRRRFKAKRRRKVRIDIRRATYAYWAAIPRKDRDEAYAQLKLTMRTIYNQCMDIPNV